MNQSTFGSRLAQARERAGLTQEQLAKGMGGDGRDLVRGSIWSWEHDESVPNARQLTKLCDRLGVTSDYLLGREQAANDSEHKTTARG